MKKILFLSLALSLAVFGAEALSGEVQKQPLNISAIIMFLVFVAGTLGITYWAAKRTKTAKDFYTAAAGSPVFKMVWQSLEIICPLHHFWEFRHWFTGQDLMDLYIL